MSLSSDELIEIFRGFYKWDKRRLSVLSNLICSIVRSRSVNLQKVSENMEGKASVASNYRRLQRLFEKQEVDMSATATLLSTLLPSTEGWTLTLDRTNWKLGKSNINLLVLGACHDGVAVPLLWEFLTTDESNEEEITGKRGNSNTAEREDLLSRFIRLFGSEKIKALTADREFIGNTWFQWLEENNIPFVIRIRNNSTLEDGSSAIKLFKGFAQEAFEVQKQVALFEGFYSLGHIEMKTAKEPLLLLISQGMEEEAQAIYKQRWEIETLFGFLKSKGFNLEESKITEKKKVEKLFAFLSISFLWAIRAGEFKEKEKPTALKKNGIPH